MDTGSSVYHMARHRVKETGTYIEKGRYRTLLQEIHSDLETPIGIALGDTTRVTDENNAIEDRGSDPHIR